MSVVKVLIWNEYRHERSQPAVKQVYAEGIHATLAEKLGAHRDLLVRTATLDEPEHGLTEAVLTDTDVLFWWGHAAHDEVADEVVERVQRHVLEGMGLVVLHSGHFSKVFRRLMGTTCSLRWREAGEKARLWNIAPAHPIMAGIGDCVELPATEMYGEPFDIPAPDELLLIAWFAGGEVFRSGCTWRRGHGRIFYFSPGHETFPIYHQPEVLTILANAARWARPQLRREHHCPNVDPLEKLSP